MTKTTSPQRITTTYDNVWTGDILDGYQVTATETNTDGSQVRFNLTGNGWTEFLSVDWRCSVYR